MNKLYQDDLINAINGVKNIDRLNDKTIFVTGANGLIGRFIVDLIMYLNSQKNYNINLIANSRSVKKIKDNFANYINDNKFNYYIGDINDKITYNGKVDFIINCASNTHPEQYSTDPINTILTNIKGTENVLDFATRIKARTIFLSSVEIYGENKQNIGRFKENQMGYIDCNSLRAGYNEGKRTGEALCQAYKEKNNIEIVLVRLPRIYGPTIKKDDSKALSQFINKAIAGEDIVLKSLGNQYFSYIYVADAVSGILTILINGENGEVYNLGNIKSEVHLKDLANIVAYNVNRKVIYELPCEMEEKGYSKSTDARLDYSKIESQLDWKPKYSIEDGVKRTIEILKEQG